MPFWFIHGKISNVGGVSYCHYSLWNAAPFYDIRIHQIQASTVSTSSMYSSRLAVTKTSISYIFQFRPRSYLGLWAASMSVGDEIRRLHCGRTRGGYSLASGGNIYGIRHSATDMGSYAVRCGDPTNWRAVRGGSGGYKLRLPVCMVNVGSMFTLVHENSHEFLFI